MFYVLHGDDTYGQSEELAKLAAKMGDRELAELNTVRLDGRSTMWDELYTHCSSIPLLADRRMVVVTGLLARLAERADSAANQTYLERLVEYIPDLPPSTRLVFVESKSLHKNHPLLELARQRSDGYEHCFEKPTGNALTRWVRQRVNDEGGEIDTHTAGVLCAYVGDDLHHLRQEVQKLVAYTNGERPISDQDIQLLTPSAQQANIYDMVDALGRRDGRSAIDIYHRLLNTGAHPLALLGMITRQFRLMAQVKELAPRLGTADAIARELHQHPYPIRKILAQSANYTPDQLRTVYRKLLDTDVAIKTGQTDQALALDTLIAGLSRVA